MPANITPAHISHTLEKCWGIWVLISHSTILYAAVIADSSPHGGIPENVSSFRLLATCHQFLDQTTHSPMNVMQKRLNSCHISLLVVGFPNEITSGATETIRVEYFECTPMRSASSIFSGCSKSTIIESPWITFFESWYLICNSKVSQLDYSLLRQQNIGSLDILKTLDGSSVQVTLWITLWEWIKDRATNVCLVYIHVSVSDLIRSNPALSTRKTSVLFNYIAKRSVLHVLQHYKYIVVVVNCLDVFYHMWVFEFLQ